MRHATFFLLPNCSERTMARPRTPCRSYSRRVKGVGGIIPIARPVGFEPTTGTLARTCPIHWATGACGAAPRQKPSRQTRASGGCHSVLLIYGTHSRAAAGFSTLPGYFYPFILLIAVRLRRME